MGLGDEMRRNSYLAERIRLAMSHARLNMTQLAEICEVTKSSVSLWVHTDPERRSVPGDENLHCIAKATGVDYRWLTGEQAEGGPEGRDPSIDTKDAIHNMHSRLIHRRSSKSIATIRKNLRDRAEIEIAEADSLYIPGDHREASKPALRRAHGARKLVENLNVEVSNQMGKKQYPHIYTYLSERLVLDIVPIGVKFHISRSKDNSGHKMRGFSVAPSSHPRMVEAGWQMMMTRRISENIGLSGREYMLCLMPEVLFVYGGLAKGIGSLPITPPPPVDEFDPDGASYAFQEEFEVWFHDNFSHVEALAQSGFLSQAEDECGLMGLHVEAFNDEHELYEFILKRQNNFNPFR